MDQKRAQTPVRVVQNVCGWHVSAHTIIAVFDLGPCHSSSGAHSWLTGVVHSLEALENFIQSQKTLLARTNADIERLMDLRRDVEATPPQSLNALSEKISSPAFKLSEQADAMPPLPEGIDWSLFGGADPAPFKNMAATARGAYSARNTPPKAPLKPASELRKLVTQTRASILDPVLSAFRLPAELALLSDDDGPDPEEQRRVREREKIRELKKRRIVGDTDISSFAGLGLRRPVATQGVFIRQDQEDESAEVDISADNVGRTRLSTSEAAYMEVDSSLNSPSKTSSPRPVSSTLPSSRTVSARERKLCRKAQDDTKASSTRTKNTGKAKATPVSQAEVRGDSPEPSAEPLRGKNGKAKSETYKQAWSVSEQHLLERLLEEIPDGEKNRWAKISKAMNGRRTARQVASRVQKYYEKLKRFGVEIGSSKAGGGG
ncbi:hypothetical protein BC628DRAFT_183959 [Trametes gibbosa]|nr:hypothetical protein BC628DRAFT_183959 [Trametes gibbosa]